MPSEASKIRGRPDSVGPVGFPPCATAGAGSAAAGAPTLGLFGPSQHLRYRPWGPRSAFVRSPRDPGEYAALFQTGGYEKSYMTDVGVADALRAANELLERTSDDAPILTAL